MTRVPSGLVPGAKLGPFEIVAPLGAGGMGEVYRARDPRLGREVAIKVLPAHLIGNAEARARFEREARSVSSLNHPHICVLHDVGREGDTDYLVMELIEGDTLADRIARGPLPIGDVLRIGAQIADALDKAHRAGIVHRDLKPANVMITKSGVKLMDFGLARASGAAVITEGMTQAPTAADPVTARGTILGTFQYMAPEQLEARDADARTDLWALGCVLYEMATGARPFSGGTSASLISAILRDVPRPMMDLAPLSPPAFERAVKQCLAKDPDDRWQSAGDLKRELEWIAGGSASMPVAAAARPRNRGRWVAGLVLAGLALAGIAWIARRPAPGGSIDVAIAPPGGVQIASPISRPMPIAISSDGSRIAFVAHRTEGFDQIWVRTLTNSEARPLAGTERGEAPFFSPDGRSIGFFAEGKLKRVDLDGGPVIVLADTPDPRGGSWSSDGTIVFAPTGVSPLFRVPAGGGPAIACTVLDTVNGESTHRYPHVLPDGRHMLYLARRAGSGPGRNPTVYVTDLQKGTRVSLLEVPSNVAYASGHLLFVRQGALVAQSYDLGRNALRGRELVLMNDVSIDERFSRASFAVSQTGVLLALTGRAETRAQLRWRERDGRPGGFVGQPADYAFGGFPCISPDGRSSAMSVVNPQRGNADVWIVDLASGNSRRLTADTDDHYGCVWSRDGRSVFMSGSVAPSQSRRYIGSRPAQGLGGIRKVIEVAGLNNGVTPLSESPSGPLLYSVNSQRPALWVVTAPQPPVRLLPETVAGIQYSGAFSADGRYIVYDSDESGRFEVYVTPYPWTGDRWQVSREGGWAPRWSRNGHEILFVDLQNRLTSAAVTPAAGALEFGAARPLFSLSATLNTAGWVWDEAPDGRILVAEMPAGSAGPPLRLLTNWTARLDAK